jgi:hypothetical protein
VPTEFPPPRTVLASSNSFRYPLFDPP